MRRMRLFPKMMAITIVFAILFVIGTTGTAAQTQNASQTMQALQHRSRIDPRTKTRGSGSVPAKKEFWQATVEKSCAHPLQCFGKPIN